MKTKEFKRLLTRLNTIVKSTSLDGVFDDIVNFFDIVNYINDNMTKKEIDKIPVKGRGKFLFISAEIKYMLSKAKKDEVIKALSKASRDPYGMNRNQQFTSKHTTYCGNTIGIWTNTVWFFEHEADEEIRKIIAYQLYSYLKSFNNIFNPDWIR